MLIFIFYFVNDYWGIFLLEIDKKWFGDGLSI